MHADFWQFTREKVIYFPKGMQRYIPEVVYSVSVQYICFFLTFLEWFCL